MSGFSETTMHDRLQKLTNTLNSIQTLRLWLIHHQKKHEETIVHTWLKEVKSNTSADRLSTLMNLANDVIQNSRKKCPQFMAAFLTVLKPAISHIGEVGGEHAIRSTFRILDVWQERSIYSSTQLRELRECLDRNGQSSGQNSAEGLSSPGMDPHSPSSLSPSTTLTKRNNNGYDSEEGDSSPVDHHSSTSRLFSHKSPPEATESVEKKRPRLDTKALYRTSNALLARLRKLEEPASADGQVRKQIASYPAQIANPALLIEIKSRDQAEELRAKIEEASPLVSAYCNRLKAEVEDRQTVQQLIVDFMDSLTAVSERNEALISSVRKRIARIDKESAELEKHIESLPDLDDVFGEKLSTSRLPSLGDLFK